MMETFNGVLGFVQGDSTIWRPAAGPAKEHRNGSLPRRTHDPEFLRAVGWEVGEQKPADRFTPVVPHVGLAMVTPYQGYAHWRVRHEWVEQMRRNKGDAWHHCRMVVRLYDVSYVVFNGLNANRIQDHTIQHLTGHLFFKLSQPGTWQLAEVGFLLRSGEFLAAARSNVVRFAPDAACPRSDHGALLVDGKGRVEEVGNLWEQEKILEERRKPRLRQRLRIGVVAWAPGLPGRDDAPARFVSELAAGKAAAGHEVHVLAPASPSLREPCLIDGVAYHPLDAGMDGSPLEQSQAFARAAEECLRELPPFDLVHVHEWMAARLPRSGARPTVLSLSSIEATRRNGTPPGELSRAVEQAERDAAQRADFVLTPAWLRDKAITELGVDGRQVRAFPMEGRLPNEWECPLDFGHVKMGIGFGPLDRLLLFVGPLEHAAGPDLLVEALPTLLHRCGNLRVAFAGAGPLHGHLQHRAHGLGVAHAVRLLGHADGEHVKRLVRAAEALVLPSRHRVPWDDAVVDLARRAGRPVVTTHGGPAHLVRHEETGLITYDNPGSMVWAVDRVLGDPAHAERMGSKGKRATDSTLCWGEVARHYLEFCAANFPELTEMR